MAPTPTQLPAITAFSEMASLGPDLIRKSKMLLRDVDLKLKLSTFFGQAFFHHFEEIDIISHIFVR